MLVRKAWALVVLVIGMMMSVGPAAAAALTEATPPAPSLLFIATSNVPAGKFQVLREIAGPHGLGVAHRYLEDIPADSDASLFDGYAMVLIDTYQQDAVRAKLQQALGQTSTPVAWLYDEAPAGARLPEALAPRLAAYYSNGGRGNFEAFFATLAAYLDGREPDAIPAPVIFPDVAVYHPEAPELVFADSREYLRWRGVDPADRPPVVAIALHQQYVSAMQTAVIDDLIRRIEAGGAVALPFYAPTADATATLRMLAPDGMAVADALVNTRIVLGPANLRKELEQLGLPVVQATPYRRGGEDDWRADPQGIALMDVPFYMAQPEFAGIIDLQVASVTGADGAPAPIAAQAQAVVNKVLNLVALQRKDNARKAVTLFFWNYPLGEKNLSASFLNVPRSLMGLLGAMQSAGYDTHSPDEATLLAQLQRLLEPLYRDVPLQDLLDVDLAVRLPVADYERWLSTLPSAVDAALRARWGAPEDSSMVLRDDTGVAWFVIPRLRLGQVNLLPQPPRGEKGEDKETALYHSNSAVPPHFYLAVYLWAREAANSDAFVHFGTHGSQEWLPGKERGLSVHDYPMLAVGDVPVVYPYIVDNIGEAQQARRRGRAVIISHQTAAFKPAGMHETLTAMHDLLHQWLAQGDGAVREQLRLDLTRSAAASHIDRDMGWSAERIGADFPGFVDALHAHLHELATMAQPLGLHTLGQPAAVEHRLATVLLMLGQEYWDAASRHAGVAESELDEALTGDYAQLDAAAPYALLQRVIVEGEAIDAMPAALRDMLKRGGRWYEDLSAAREIPAILAALSGRYIPTSYGGDPIKNPEAYPTGRNLYGFDPSRVPTPQAWQAGKQAAEDLLRTHQAQTGKPLTKTTFSLWSVETMRHQGMLEAQALWLLGVEPVWDKGGRVTGVRRVERGELGRPRVDVVLSATGLYRDHFPNVLRQLARAAQLAAEDVASDNPVARNAQRIAAELMAQGVAPAEAELAGQTRIFSAATGEYGTGLEDAALATDTWEGKVQGDQKLAALYLSRMQYAYGPDESKWGRAGVAGAGVNLYAEHLSGTEGAVLSRTSNTYGLLTTDDPFQYLGGIGLAVRSLDGQAPELYVANLRGGGAGRIEGAASFLAKELATRQFHPGFIEGLMAEGYAGTLEVLDATNNLWGWTATAREIVRDDQWQEMVEVYVKDKYQLGLDAWFEQHNPHAQAQSIERMLEAARQEYWQADAATIDLLKTRYRELAERYDVRSDNPRFLAYVADGAPAEPVLAQVVASASDPEAPAVAPADLATYEQVSGMRLDRVEGAAAAPDTFRYWAAVGLLLILLAGAWRQVAGPFSAVAARRA